MDRYCVDAPLGGPYPCEMMDAVAKLREAMGDRCQFVNLDLAYRQQGDGEPVPCCKECTEPCPFRCGQEKGEIPKEAGAGRTPAASEGPGGVPGEMKAYDRGLLEKMIAEAEHVMEVMGDGWQLAGSEYYTQTVMEIQAYKNLMAEHDAEETGGPARAEEPGQPDLPNFRNDDQRKAWIEDYKAWGLWYRDEHIDVNYYKFDFDNGSRLVAVEYPQRESVWDSGPYDPVFYHLIEKNKQKYGCIDTYDDKFQYHGTCETEIVKYLKKIQQKKKGEG